MATRWKKFIRKLRRNAKAPRGVVDTRFLRGEEKKPKDISAKEQEFREFKVSGKVPTKRRKDGTIILREKITDSGKVMGDNDIDQLIPVDMFRQNYDHGEIENIIENNLEELLPDQLGQEDKIKKFFLDFEKLKADIEPVAGDESHQHLVDAASRFIPQIDPVEPLPEPENMIKNGIFEDGELPEISSKAENHQVVDDPTEIRPTSQVLQFFGNQPGHLFIHKKDDETKLKRGGLYECSYLVYVSDDYDGSHGVEFSTWKNLDPDLTVMTPIGNLPYTEDKKIIKGRWVRRNFWVKLPYKGEPTDFNWKLAYPMGVRPKGVNPGDAIGSSVYKIKLLKNYVKPEKEDFYKHKRLGMLWKEMTDGNAMTGGDGGMFEGLTKFFDKLAEEMNDRFNRAKLMGTEIRKELIDGKLESVPEGKQEVGKTVHPLSIHDKGKHFEIWFALKDVSKKHHKAILEAILNRFDSLTWHPSDPKQDMFDTPKEIFDSAVTIGDTIPQVLVSNDPAPQNINIKQPEIGMTMDGIETKVEPTKIDIPSLIASQTGVSTDASQKGMSDEDIRKVIQDELSKLNLGVATPAASGGGGSKGGSSDFEKAVKQGAKGGAELLGGEHTVLGKVGALAGGAVGVAVGAVRAVGKGIERLGRNIGRALGLRRLFRRRRRRRRRRRSDIRLKQNIVLLGQSKSGLNIYEYNYIWSDRKYKGVIAQEVKDKYPKAVSKDIWNGYYTVDYDKIDVDFEEQLYDKVEFEEA